MRILFAAAMFAGACLAPVAASAEESGEGAAGKPLTTRSTASPSPRRVKPPTLRPTKSASSTKSSPPSPTRDIGLRRRARLGRTPTPSGSRRPRRPGRFLIPCAGRCATYRGLLRAPIAPRTEPAGRRSARRCAWLGARIHVATTDQDSAREAVKKGQIVPLASILKNMRESVPGDVLKVALVS